MLLQIYLLLLFGCFTSFETCEKISSICNINLLPKEYYSSDDDRFTSFGRLYNNSLEPVRSTITIFQNNGEVEWVVNEFGIIELITLKKKYKYLLYDLQKIVDAINKKEYNKDFPEFKEKKFYNSDNTLFNGAIKLTYHSLSTTIFPDDSIVTFKYGIVWNIKELNHNQIYITTFDMDEQILFYNKYRRIMKEYYDPETTYMGSGNPPYIAPFPMPNYIKIE